MCPSPITIKSGNAGILIHAVKFLTTYCKANNLISVQVS